MNARSTLDVLAHEINFIYRYMGVTNHGVSFFDYTNSSEEKKVSLQEVKKKLYSICPKEPLTALLDLEMKNGGWSQLSRFIHMGYTCEV